MCSYPNCDLYCPKSRRLSIRWMKDNKLLVYDESWRFNIWHKSLSLCQLGPTINDVFSFTVKNYLLSLNLLSSVGRLTYFTDWQSKRNRSEKKLKQREVGINSVELCYKARHIFPLRLHATMYVSVMKNTSSNIGTFPAHWYNVTAVRGSRRARGFRAVSHLLLGLPSGSSPRGFPTTILCKFVSFIRATFKISTLPPPSKPSLKIALTFHASR